MTDNKTIARFNAARNALSEASSIDEVKDVRDKAEALRLYAIQRRESFGMQNDIAEIKIRAERRIGEMIPQMQERGELAKRGGDRKSNSDDMSLKLEDIGITHNQSADWQASARLPEDVFEEHIATTKAKADEITSAGVKRLVAEHGGASQPVEVTIFSHKTVEYYTPPIYIEAAREVMGGIDLDPASCEDAQGWIKAETFYSESDNGLLQPWFGRVWLNPPYSKTGAKSNQEIWSDLLTKNYEEKKVSEAVLLVKAALGYNWFENLWYDWPTCFVRSRLSFVKKDGTSDGQSKQGSAFLYFGLNIDRFVSVFRQFGRVVLPNDGFKPL